ncbi:type IV secretory system conjugative DNA transfer family protein (plasmid) [Sphingomonas aliaeris]|uniref:Type IV secretory system conjugative DNA transfer family protein n=1 Tax=Sphingomonas aliaeris TaxID=2759526 RepID=A0A974NZ69_9SPHN|nr:type IV secretory system conjugative DNA transfer family protein [Sphingomonas aliaeris]QQV79473.1 type IV secretory system conjugative DNA transfer family protein [Sphingomonas aliaeris]
MSGKWVRSAEGSQPAAIVFLALMGTAVSAAFGAVAVLFKAHLLTGRTPWSRVPGALWTMKAYPIVYGPFLVGFAIGMVLTILMMISSLFRRQRLHGEARWARIGEARRGKLLESSGIVLGKLGGKVMRFGGPEHVLLEAPTRAGKGVGVIIPNLLEWPDSLVVLDIKQENFENTAGYRLKVLGQRVVLFNPLDPKGNTARYNPLSYITRDDPVEVINELQKIGQMLFPDPVSGENFWAESARTAFLGVAAYVAATVDDDDDALPFTMGEVYRQFAAGDAAKRFPKIISRREQAGKPLSGGCVSALRDFTTASPNTFTSIRQSVTAKINAWLNPYVDAATSQSDFDLSEFRDKRISLYLGVSPDDLERVAPIYGLLFQQLIDRNVRELPKGDRHQVKVLVALDEFASLGKCSVLAQAFSYVAGYGLRLLPAFQSIEQIQGVYGDKVAADIERNCAVRLVLRPAGLSDAKKISDQLGTYTFKARSRSMGTWGGGGGSTSESEQRRPLLLPQEVEMLPENDLIVFRRGMYATYGRKVRYYAEKQLKARTQIPAPAMPAIRVDPTVASNSLRVIQAAEAESERCASADHQAANSSGAAAPVWIAATPASRLNRAAIDAARAAPHDQRTSTLFGQLVTLT